jgi:hypothetical protein
MEEITQYTPEEIIRGKSQNFLKLINKPNNPKEVKVNKFANSSKYIPISFIETRLDRYFFGFWETVNFQTSVIVNEVIGSIELKVKHPVTGEWLTRTGAAAVPIQMKQGSGVTQVDQKIHNTLVKDYPHLKAMCVLNACKSLGKLFGRDLNREFEDDYQPLLRLPENDPISNAQAQMIDGLLHTSNLDDRQKMQIELHLTSYNSRDAGEIIENLLQNQQTTLEQDLNFKLKSDD